VEKINTIELFAGSCSFSNVAKNYGINTFTVDNVQYGKIDYVVDILEFDYNKIPYDKVDFIWASPPCTAFSVASMWRHWTKDNKPKSETGIMGKKLVQKTLEIIKHIQPTKGWIIENPMGKLRKLDIIDNKYLHTVTYCQYGHPNMKYTDLWTNLQWTPRPQCKVGMPCHEAAPRGSYKGTLAQKNAYERSKVPNQLCKEIVELIL
jgi:hypothetical protein|tara:strand:+ start:256 stop:873 length:618 start_codon:yes stop_codon:yes gene_type:complete